MVVELCRRLNGIRLRSSWPGRSAFQAGRRWASFDAAFRGASPRPAASGAMPGRPRRPLVDDESAQRIFNIALPH